MNRNLRIGTFAPVMVLVMVIAGACSAEGIPTKFAPVNESLGMLLNQGWTIVTGDLAGLILQNGGKWVSCKITVVREGGGGTKGISFCTALN